MTRWLIFRQDKFVGTGAGNTAIQAIDDWMNRDQPRRWLRGPYVAVLSTLKIVEKAK